MVYKTIMQHTKNYVNHRLSWKIKIKSTLKINYFGYKLNSRTYYKKFQKKMFVFLFYSSIRFTFGFVNLNKTIVYWMTN